MSLPGVYRHWIDQDPGNFRCAYKFFWETQAQNTPDDWVDLSADSSVLWEQIEALEVPEPFRSWLEEKPLHREIFRAFYLGMADRKLERFKAGGGWSALGRGATSRGFLARSAEGDAYESGYELVERQ